MRATLSDPYLMTAPGWAKLVKQALRIVKGQEKLKSTRLWNMCLDPDVLVESVELIYLGQFLRKAPKPYWRIGSLVFILASRSGP
jgi:hypothetical protein